MFDLEPESEFADTGALQVLPELTDEDKRLMSVGPKSDEDFERLEELTGVDAADWRVYWAFRTKHGEPMHVRSEGKLLFPDAWQYSATRPAGPSYPPPSGPVEVLRLKLLYWESRRNYVLREAAALRAVLCDPRVDESPEAFGGLRSRLKWLEAAAVECTTRLRELEG